MSGPDEQIERLVRDPSLLIRLCRDVIEQLEAQADSAEVSEKTAQLREISRTVERLEKAGVPVPDTVRSEKLRLASLLGVKADATQALAQLAGE
jgi:hypothetical protein